MSYHARITAMYERYAPEKVAQVDATLTKYAGAEEQLMEALVKKYGPEPAAAAAPGSPTAPASPAPAAAPAAAAPAAAAPAAATSGGGGADYRTRITAMYERYAPEKVAQVDATLTKYAGAEEQLMEALVKKYGPEPVVGGVRGLSVSSNPFVARLHAFYAAYCPAKLSTVEATLLKYAGREEEFFMALVKKYGPEPVAAEAAPRMSALELLQREEEESRAEVAASVAAEVSRLHGERTALSSQYLESEFKAAVVADAWHFAFECFFEEEALLRVAVCDEEAMFEVPGHVPFPFTAVDSRAVVHKFFVSLGCEVCDVGQVIDREVVELLLAALDLEVSPIFESEFYALDDFILLITGRCFCERTLLERMSSFITFATQKTVVQRLCVDDVDVARGLWMHKCVFPCVVERWSRVWVVLKGDRLLWQLPNSNRAQGAVPLEHILDVSQLSLLHTGAPRKFARNGVSIRLTDSVNPLVVSLCGETMQASRTLVQRLRCSGPGSSPSPSPVAWASPSPERSATPPVLGGNVSHQVWCCRSGYSKWIVSSWELHGRHVVHRTPSSASRFVFPYDMIEDVALSSCSGTNPPQRFRAFGFVLHLREGSLFCCAESLVERTVIVKHLKKCVLRASIAASSRSPSVATVGHEADSPLRLRVPGTTPAAKVTRQQKSAARDSH